MIKIMAISIALLISMPVFAGGLTVDSRYELNKSIKLTETSPTACTGTEIGNITAAKRSKFSVITDANNCYIVRFNKIWDYGKQKSDVTEDKEYYLPKIINHVPIEKSVTAYGETSGVLVLPFKIRNEDESIAAGNTVGAYVGWDLKIFEVIVAGGLTQIDVTTATSSESNTGITAAVGIIFNNWNGVDFGVVYGADHLGGSAGDNWLYEDDPWLSLMIGWNFTQ